MHRIFLILFGISFIVYSSQAYDVPELSDADFESRIIQFDVSLVLFYAPWCGHCKKLKPEFNQAARELSDNNPPVTLFQIDCIEAGKDTCIKYEIGGYPTMKVFKNGKFTHDLENIQTSSAIIEYMKNQLGPAFTKITSSSEFETLINTSYKNILVGFFEKSSSELEEVFRAVAENLRNKLLFVYISEPELIEYFNKTEGLVFFRAHHLRNKFEMDYIIYTGPTNTKELQDFIKINFHGLVGHRQVDNQADFQLPLIIAYYTVNYKQNKKRTNYWRNRIMKVAKDYKGIMNFAISSSADFKDDLLSFGLNEYMKNDVPVIVARDIKNRKFKMKQPFSVEALNMFLFEFMASKLKPFIRSEVKPIINPGPILSVVALNFEEIVIKNEKDVMIMYYAPWCSHCKQLLPVYEQVSIAMKKENVAIARMDATANDIPENHTVTGFPTIYWIRSDAKYSPQRYDGGREYMDFIRFIAKHATRELNYYDRKGIDRDLKDEL